jgi:holo-[acyl-carrier protein] synthase
VGWVLRVGTDLTSVPEVRAAITAHGERYLRRIFAPEELHDAQGDPQRLAARFAAKEAVLKVLRPGDDPLPWNEIRVRRHPEGWTDLVLSGRAAERARTVGVEEWAVSLTHEGDLASAVVVATTRTVTPTITDAP